MPRHPMHGSSRGPAPHRAPAAPFAFATFAAIATRVTRVTRTTIGMRAALAALAALALAPTMGCSARASSAPAPAASSSVEVHSTGASIASLQVAPESLQVDKVGGRDGYLYPDGLRDLVFTADVTGPISAFFLLSTDERGEPNGFFRTNTLTRAEEAPKEFGGMLELGRMTPGLGVYEEGKPLNKDSGAVNVPAGRHLLKLYTSNPGNVTSRSYLRLFGVLADKSIVKSPILAIP
ncbi:hypothetical protein [Pendulispora albinea]|uniref:Lipoprotein n=1 Tax=Pendulispora albinea TaxID=2741071 RepID=A0ABZ2M884_9BACT